jgi:hypothetical protein
MANLYNTRVYGSITIDTAITSGCGFQNMVVLTTGTSATYTFPSVLQVPGAKFKVTIVGGGGGGAGSSSGNSSSGGSGALVIAIPVIIVGLYSFTYTIGAGGSAGASTPSAGGNGGDSSIIYNGISYVAGGGKGGNIINQADPGGQGGSATFGNGILNLTGNPGVQAGTPSTTNYPIVRGGYTPLGLGSGGGIPRSTGTGLAGSNYGAGGGAGIVRSVNAAGAAGQPGVIILEY